MLMIVVRLKIEYHFLYMNIIFHSRHHIYYERPVKNYIIMYIILVIIYY